MKFTLDDIRDAAEKKYGATVIDVDGQEVELVNALRLKKGDRQALVALQDKLEAEGADQEELLKEALRTVAKTKTQANRLIGAIGDDLAVLAEVFERYTGDSELGEASPSQS